MPAQNARSKSQAIDFFKAADGHLSAAKILEPHIGLVEAKFSTTTSVFLAFYNVLGFAVELYLKAYLVSMDFEAAQLAKRPFAHNLRALYDAAKEAGLYLPKGRDTVSAIIDQIGTGHADYTYRYLYEGARLQFFLKGEPTQIVFAGLDELHQRVFEKLPDPGC